MKNTFQFIALLIVLIILPSKSFAWGKQGHSIVAEVAFNYLDANTKSNLLKYLDGMSIEDAANWMDDMRDDHSFDYMKPYHYVNFEKGSIVKVNPGNNLLSVLTNTINDLKNYKSFNKEEVKMKLCILFHLIGDLHQPLHVGYGDDKGGNTMQINYNGYGTNLHSFFDSGIIKAKNITLQDCLKSNKFSSTEIKNIQYINVSEWATQSRSNLDEIYNFSVHIVQDEYVNANAVIIENQLLKAGLRLASVLNEVFKKI
jgi:hypothetical protein